MKLRFLLFLSALIFTSYAFAQVDLFELIIAGDIEAVKLEIANDDKRINEIDSNHNNLLHALAAGDEIALPQLIKLADWLVRAGANLRARNLDGLTPAEVAREHNNFDIAEILTVEEPAVHTDTPSSTSSQVFSGGFSSDNPDNSKRPGFHGASHATDLVVLPVPVDMLEQLASLSDSVSPEQLREILITAYAMESLFEGADNTLPIALLPFKQTGETPVVLRLRRLGLLNFGPRKIVEAVIRTRKLKDDHSGEFLLMRTGSSEESARPRILEGKLGLMLSYSDDLKIVLASLSRGFREAYLSGERLVALLSDEKIDLLERLKLVGVDIIPPKDTPNRIKALQSAKKLAREILEKVTRTWRSSGSHILKNLALNLESNQLDLLNAYLLYEWLENQLEFDIAQRDAPSPDLYAPKIWHNFFSGMGQMATARQMLRPFANLFQDLIDGPQLEPLELERELLGEFETEETSTRKIKKRHRRRPKGKERENASAKTSTLTEDGVEEAQDPAATDESVPTIVVRVQASPTRKSPQQRDQERRERATRIVEQHKRISSSSTSSSSSSASFRQLRNALSPEEAEVVIESLNKRQQEVFGVLFNHRHDQSDRKISHHDVLALARAIQDLVIQIRQEWDDSFYKLVKRHLHPAHDSSDTGDLLPKHYLDVLRTFFIMFGAAPKDWR